MLPPFLFRICAASGCRLHGCVDSVCDFHSTDPGSIPSRGTCLLMYACLPACSCLHVCVEIPSARITGSTCLARLVAAIRVVSAVLHTTALTGAAVAWNVVLAKRCRRRATCVLACIPTAWSPTAFRDSDGHCSNAPSHARSLPFFLANIYTAPMGTVYMTEMDIAATRLLKHAPSFLLLHKVRVQYTG